MKKTLLIYLALFASSLAFGQGQKTFQKIFRQPFMGSSLQTFDVKQTWDGGYILTGIVSDTNSNQYHPFIMRLDCQEKIVWKQDFGNTQSTSNIYPRVIITHDSQFVIINNIGVYTNYSGFVAKLDDNGIILWQKSLNLKPGNDNINSIAETSDHGYIITGAAGSTPDVALVKLDSSGDILWQKTFGNPTEIDEGTSVIQTNDGGFAVTGRYISMGTFMTLFLKTDSLGNMQFLKCYGDTLQHMRGMDIKELSNGDYAIVGSTTLLKPSFQSFGDNFIMRLNNVGDTLWTKIFYGSQDSYENASNFYIDNSGNFIVGIATASYPTSAIVPNKHAIAKFSSYGSLISLYTYNDGYSHYPMVVKANDGGTILSGFSTKYTGPVGFNTLLIKTDQNLHTTCAETDVTFNTFVQSILFKVTTPTPFLNITPGTSNNTSITTTHYTYDTTICELVINPTASFATTTGCLNTPVSFNADSLGNTTYYWEFGDATTNNDTSTSKNATYTYNATGTYNVTLIVSNGCLYDTLVQQVTIYNLPQPFSLGNDTTICKGASITIGINNNSYAYLWNTGAITPFISTSTPGTYILTASTQFCGSIRDTIKIDTINCETSVVNYTKQRCNFFVPNAFSPNGDHQNDIFKPSMPKDIHTIKFELMNIYNRYGHIVFSTTDHTMGWDGKYKGVEQSSDVFYYMIRYTCEDETLIMKGDITLIK